MVDIRFFCVHEVNSCEYFILISAFNQMAYLLMIQRSCRAQVPVIKSYDKTWYTYLVHMGKLDIFVITSMITLKTPPYSLITYLRVCLRLRIDLFGVILYLY